MRAIALGQNLFFIFYSSNFLTHVESLLCTKIILSGQTSASASASPLSMSSGEHLKIDYSTF